MGNLCGKQSSNDNFAGPGRTLGSAPPRNENARSTIPAAVGGAKSTKPGAGQGRALGGGGGQEGNSGDARSAAARAAEDRANKAQGTGKLGKALDEQKKKTDRQVLSDVSEERRAQRDADAATEARNWN